MAHLRQRRAQRRAGDLYPPAVGLIHLEYKRDGAGDGQGSHAQGGYYCSVVAREQTEAEEQNAPPRYEHDKEGPGERPPRLRNEQVPGIANVAKQFQGATLTESL